MIAETIKSRGRMSKNNIVMKSENIVIQITNEQIGNNELKRSVKRIKQKMPCKMHDIYQSGTIIRFVYSFQFFFCFNVHSFSF